MFQFLNISPLSRSALVINSHRAFTYNNERVIALFVLNAKNKSRNVNFSHVEFH